MKKNVYITEKDGQDVLFVNINDKRDYFICFCADNDVEDVEENIKFKIVSVDDFNGEVTMANIDDDRETYICL